MYLSLLSSLPYTLLFSHKFKLPTTAHTHTLIQKLWLGTIKRREKYDSLEFESIWLLSEFPKHRNHCHSHWSWISPRQNALPWSKTFYLSETYKQKIWFHRKKVEWFSQWWEWFGAQPFSTVAMLGLRALGWPAGPPVTWIWE